MLKFLFPSLSCSIAPSLSLLPVFFFLLVSLIQLGQSLHCFLQLDGLLRVSILQNACTAINKNESLNYVKLLNFIFL